MIRCLLCVLFGLLLQQASFAQDSITMAEALQIQSNSQLLVIKEYQEFLNSIATESDKRTLDEMILNSFTEKNSRIFDSSTVIENDVDPSQTAASAKHDDWNVKQYLEYFSLFYTKSDNASVRFTLDKLSNVKVLKNRLYVKVYFSSYFGNKYKSDGSSYTINSRVAEVAVRKVNNDWSPAIVRIDFYNAADTLNDLENDIRISDMAVSNGFIQTGGTSTDFFEKRRQDKLAQRVEEQRQTLERFAKLMDDGDKAYQRNDMDEALSNYRKAKELRSYDKNAIVKINMVLDQQDKEKRSRAQNFEMYVQKAKEAKSKRDIRAAIDNYQEAKNIDQDKAASFANDLDQLRNRYSNLEKMRELYKIAKYAEAISNYSAILKKGDNLSNIEKSDYYNGRGLCYEKTNDAKKALKDYTSAIELDKDNVEAYINRARINKNSGQYLEAINDHKFAITIYKQNPLNYLQLAELRLLNNNQRSEAIDVLNEGLKIESLQNIPDLYLRRGQLYLDNKSWDKANADFTAVIATDSNNAVGFYNRGMSYIALKNVEKAAIDFEKAKSKGLDASYNNYINNLAQDYYLGAERNANNRSMDSAMILVNYAILVNPGNDLYKSTKGNYLFAAEKYHDAISFYDQAIAINSKNIDAYNKRGLSYHMSGDDKKAIEDLNTGLSLDPLNYNAFKTLGDALFATGNYADASVKYQAALGLMSKQKVSNDAVEAEINNSLGKSFYKLGDYEQSVNALKNAIKKNDRFSEAYYNRGLSYYSSGKLEEAIGDLNKSLSLDSKNLYAYYYMAKAYQATKKYPDAVLYYTHTLNKDSNHVFKDVIASRGISAYEMKDFKAALPDYLAMQHAGLDSGNTSFNFQLGTIYLNQTPPVPDSAIYFLTKAVETNSTDGNAAFGLGIAYVQKARVDDAIPWLDKALQFKATTAKKLKNDARMDAIQDDKRFKDLLKKY